MRRLTSMILSFLGGIVGAVAFLGAVGANSGPQKAAESGVLKRISADSVTAHSVNVVDASGNQAIALSVGQSGPSIRVFDSDGSQVVLILAGKSGPQVAVSNRENTAEAKLAAGTPGAFVGVESPQKLHPSVSLNYVSGKVSMTIDDAGGQNRVVLGQTGLVRKSSGVSEDTPVGSASVFDEVGTLVWRVPH